MDLKNWWGQNMISLEIESHLDIYCIMWRYYQELSWLYLSKINSSTHCFSILGVLKKTDTQRFKQLYSAEFLFSHVIWFPLNSFIFLAAAYTSPQNIMSSYPRRVEYAMGFQFILVCLRMQYTSVTMEKLNPFRRTNLLTWSLLIA